MSRRKVEEPRSGQLNVKITPSVLRDLKKVATMTETNVNKLAFEVLRDYVQKNQHHVQRYDQVFLNQNDSVQRTPITE